LRRFGITLRLRALFGLLLALERRPIAFPRRSERESYKERPCSSSNNKRNQLALSHLPPPAKDLSYAYFKLAHSANPRL
jgi:hypothetical protein